MIDATGQVPRRRFRRWRVSLVLIAGGLVVFLVAIVLSYSVKAGTITVLNATDTPLVELRVETGGKTLEIARVEPHTSSIGYLSSGKIENPLRLRYSMKDPEHPEVEAFNRVLYKIPTEGLRSLTISTSEPAKSPLFREIRLEVSGVSNFSIPGAFTDLTHGRFPGRQTLGNSVSRYEMPFMPPIPPEPKK